MTMIRLRSTILSVSVSLLLSATLAGRAAKPAASLADAAQQQDRATFTALLRDGADVDAAQVDGMTALHWTVYHDDVAMTERLLAAGANANVENRYGVAPLTLACINGNGAIVERLLTAGADPNKPVRGGETPLMTAARTGDLRSVRALLDRGARVNAAERKGQTALMWASAEGHVEVIEALLDAGADFRKPLPSGFTPFFFAAREGRTAVVMRLLEAGVDVNAAMEPERRAGNSPLPGTSALMLAVENGHFELAAALLEAGADPNDVRCGFSPLHALTWVRKPLRGDGDPPPIGSGKMTSLELVRKLVAHGADVNVRHQKQRTFGGRLNRTDATPFLLAAETADVPLMQLLVDLGADPQLPNADHATPLLAAAGVGVLSDGDEAAGTEAEAITAIQLLLDLGADINAVDDNGETAMHGAAYKSRPALVQFLADNGADVKVWNQKNQRGWTPLLIAQGHRPGNFRPSAETIAAIQKVLSNNESPPTP